MLFFQVPNLRSCYLSWKRKCGGTHTFRTLSSVNVYFLLTIFICSRHWRFYPRYIYKILFQFTLFRSIVLMRQRMNFFLNYPKIQTQGKPLFFQKQVQVGPIYRIYLSTGTMRMWSKYSLLLVGVFGRVQIANLCDRTSLSEDSTRQ